MRRSEDTIVVVEVVTVVMVMVMVVQDVHKKTV